MLWILRYLKTAGDNFHEVVPGRIYRSATPSPENLERWYRKYGIRTWIDLRLPSDWDGDKRTTTDKHRFFNDQVAACKQLGIKRISLPCSDRLPMPDATIQTFLGYLADESNDNILFGCKGNRHRAGMLCAVFRMLVHGWSKKQAMKEAVHAGYYRRGHEKFDDRFMEVLDAAEKARK